MSINFPTSLDTLTNPTASDYLNSPSHAGQHSDVNDAIEALEAKVGIDGSSNVNSLDYKIAHADPATAIHAATEKGTPVDADELGIADSAASYALKKVLLSDLKNWVFLQEIIQMARLVLDLCEYATDALARAAFVSNGGGDDSYTKLLLHFDGTDGSASILDETGKTVTVAGAAQIDTAQYKFGGASGLFGNTTADYITLADSEDWNFGTGNFTIDFWMRKPNVNVSRDIMQHKTDANNQMYLYFDQSGNLIFRVISGGSTIVDLTQTTQGWSTNTWYHVAIVRNGNVWTMYRNGVDIKNQTASVTYPNLTGSFRIGGGGIVGAGADAWFDEIRISKGIARWTADFSSSLPSSAYESALVDYSEATIKNEGSYSVKVVAKQTKSLNFTITKTLSPTKDLSSKGFIKFFVYASRTGSNIKFGFHDSGGTTTEITPNIVAANTWQEVKLDISAVASANKDAIDQIIVTIVNADADNTFYIDNFYS